MDKRTYEALQASIEKWKRNVAAEYHAEVSLSNDSCALCELFFNYGSLEHCTCCPVRNATGKKHCWGTPYGDASTSHAIWKFNDLKEYKNYFKAAAQLEVEFLQALVPAGGWDDE